MASQHLHRLVDIFHAHRIASFSALGLAVLAPIAISDYHLYLSYGPGGLPYNAAGWLVASLLRIIAREPLSTAVYDHRGALLGDDASFLPTAFPPKRSSPRPHLGRHAIPQRQLNQLPSAGVRQRLITRFSQLGKQAEQKGLVEVRQSNLERRHEAIFVSKTRHWHALAEQTRGEITHVHEGLDGSFHVSLHPADCKAVIDAGWGQRHPLSGVELLKRLAGVSLPVHYVLIYAPRDEAEIEVAMTIMKASIGFMTGSREALE